jgi:cobalt-zinc-cadmium efflux system outer membrane protein
MRGLFAIRRARFATALGVALAASALSARGQSSEARQLTRAEAVKLALERGARAALANATVRAARAGVLAARAITNPTLSATYSKSTPQYHAIVDVPLDFLVRRPLEVSAALSASDAARYRLAFERAAIEFETDTLYTRSVARSAHAALSRANAADADSLLTIARVRRDAGDASDLDVELARVNAGQAENSAAADSLEAIFALLDLQSALGMPASHVTVVLADTLALPSSDSLARLASTSGLAPAAGVPLAVAAAEQDVRSAEESLALQRRGIWSGLALEAGVEAHDPSGSEPGLLPTFGLSVPLPFFSRNRGAVALAAASRDRARVELEAARRESAALMASARRELAAAATRAARDRGLVASADRVARMSLQAYAEGAYPLANVLEAQRNAREVLAQLIDDTAALAGAAAALRLYSLTVVP